MALDFYHKIIMAFLLFTFHIGLTLFEWGAVRKKNSDLVVLRHMFVFIISTLCIFVVGFHIAYGTYRLSLKRPALLNGETDPARNYAFGLNFLTIEANETIQLRDPKMSYTEEILVDLKSFMIHV